MSNKLIFRSLLLSVVMLIVPMLAHAFGLGNITVSSALNTPFRAEIPVTSMRAGDKDSFAVELASTSEFAKAGLDRSGALAQLRFKIIYRKGKAIIQVSSKEAMKEPFLSFLVSATTKNSKLLREYTVLLDPPTSIYEPAPVPVDVTPTRAAPRAAPTIPKPRAIPQPVAQPAVTQPRAPSLAGVGSYGTVKRGETLWTIASKVRPDFSVSQEQMMLAIVKANPNAFIDGNVNSLQTGVNLDIPTKAEIMVLSQKEAISRVNAQHAAWKGTRKVTQTEPTSEVGNQKTAGQSQATSESSSDTTDENALADKTSSERMSSEEIATAKLALSAISEADLNSDQELVAMGNEQAQAANEQLTLAKEIIEGQAQERLDLETRMTAMTTQIETLERIVSLKDAGLAQLQAQLEKSGVEPIAALEMAEIDVAPTDTEVLSEMDVAAEPQVASAKISGDVFPPVLAVEDTQVGKIDAAPQIDTEVSTEMDVAAEPEVASAKISGDVFPPVLPIEETQAGQFDLESSMDLNDDESVMDDVLLDDAELAERGINSTETGLDKIKGFLKSLLIPILLALAGLIAWLVVRWRKQQNPSDSDDKWEATTVSPDADVAPDTIVENNQLDVEIVERVEESNDVSVVDLMLEADTYINYGDYEKAKNVLEEAKQLEPNNSSIDSQLLTVLYKQQDGEGFASMAALVGDNLKQNNPTQWEQVLAWGKELSPTHALFGGLATAGLVMASEGEEASGQAEPTLDLSAIDIEDDPLDIPEIDLTGPDITDTPTLNLDDDGDSLDMPLDFNTDMDVEAADTIEFSVDTPEGEGDLEVTVSEEAIETALADSESAPVIIPDEAPTAPSMDDMASEMISDIEAETSDFDNIDEVATKLDLAAAYLDMDEPEGARTILQEVIQEGNAEQQAQAQTLLDGLA